MNFGRIIKLVAAGTAALVVSDLAVRQFVKPDTNATTAMAIKYGGAAAGIWVADMFLKI